MRLSGPEPERFVTDRVADALPGYDVSTVLGHGGHAVVLGGRHRQLGRDVAIKVLSTSGADGGAHGRFLAEARMLAALDHPHIVGIYDYVEAGDLCLLVMERLAGGSVRGLAARGLTVDVVTAVGLATCAALAGAHAGGVLHRDIKPDNILFTADALLKVTDFGIAKLVGASGAAPSTFVGTPVYMAPEQFDGRPLGPACDLYALGVVLYELLSGRPPFPRALSMTDLMSHHQHIAPLPLASAPPAIAAVVTRALAKDPAARPPSARALALDLAGAAATALGPDWLARARLPVRLDDDIRDAARGTNARGTSARGTASPATTTVARLPPTLPAATFAPLTPDLAITSSSEAPTSIPLPPPTPTPPGSVPPGSVPPGSTAPDGAAPRRWAAVLRRGPTGRATRRSVSTPPPPTVRTAGPQRVDYPYGVAAAPDGTLYVSQRLRHRVIRLDPDGQVTPVAGCGRSGGRGDGGPALDAELDNPCGLAVGRDGTLYIADSFTNRVRRVGPDGRIDTVAGRGQPGPPPGPLARAATDLTLSRPHDVSLDAEGRLYIANTGGHQIVRVDPDGRGLPLAGVGTAGQSGDRGPAQLAQLRRPHAVVTVAGTVYLADTDNHLIRAIDAAGVITTLAGRLYGACADEDAPAELADVGRPHALAALPTGDLLLADPDTAAVRVLTTDRRVRTLPGTQVPPQRPLGVAVHPDGTVLVVDTARHLLLRLPPSP